MSYSFLYTAAALLGLVTPMDQALMNALETPMMEREGAIAGAGRPLPAPLPIRPPGADWKGADWKGPDSKGTSWNNTNWPSHVQGKAEAYTVHLASYLGETWAHRGWGELVDQAPPLAKMVANFRHAEVASLGPVIRVTIGRYKTLQDATAQCAVLRRYLEYCAPLALREED